ncbi:hypothetical protein [Caudoviricetes sp.]|nr:hypothetical protein [Caudoviricetes sp.]
MMLTEKQAHMKQCCANVDERCCASGCMAWRSVASNQSQSMPDKVGCFNQFEKTESVSGDRPKRVLESWQFVPVSKTMPAHWVSPLENPEPVGYCGLAGKPD